MKGMVQVYTGDGKGKTTAALGLALRAVGAGMKTYIAQFAKGMTCSELKSIAYLQEFVTLKQYGKHTFIKDHPNIDDVECAQKGLKEVENILHVEAEGEAAPTKRSRPRSEYEINETVRVKEGPFADFSGQIAEINEDQLKVKVLVNIFGRETPVELEFSQVAKL